jgi:hypothetical protein
MYEFPNLLSLPWLATAVNTFLTATGQKAVFPHNRYHRKLKGSPLTFLLPIHQGRNSESR